jgi:hypothetical protein
VAVEVPQLFEATYEMMAVPADVPLTIFIEEPMVAMVVLLLLHKPPLPVLDSVVVPPAHSVAVPVIVPAEGDAVTVTVVIAFAEPQVLDTV